MQFLAINDGLIGPPQLHRDVRATNEPFSGWIAALAKSRANKCQPSVANG
jgi:hypothetical protein